MTDLPQPKRFVIGELKPLHNNLWYFDIYIDPEVADFVALLAPVNHSEWLNRTFRVRLDPRFAYDDETAHKTYTWICSQIANEFNGTDTPIKNQEE